MIWHRFCDESDTVINICWEHSSRFRLTKNKLDQRRELISQGILLFDG